MTQWIGGLVALAATWLLLVVVLWRVRPDETSLRECLRLLPDTARLVGRLATDPSVPTRARVLLWLLVGYLACPIDLVPDFIPVIGWADDAIVVLLALRAVLRRTPESSLARHWSGSPAGLNALTRLVAQS